MKKIENVFPELCNIYAESYSPEYLGKCNKEIQVINTNHKDEPVFVSQDVDMIYIGCSPEKKQEQIIEILMPYKDRIKKLIEKGTIFLATGNAIEIFGKSIKQNDKVIPALGIFDFTAIRYINYVNEDRHNSQYVGSFLDENNNTLTMLGHRSQFSFAYGNFDSEDFPSWLDIQIGIGMNPDTKKEGIHYKNFFATYSLGPCMIMNPFFAKYILRLMGLKDDLCFEKEIIQAYEYRKNELIKNLGQKKRKLE